MRKHTKLPSEQGLADDIALIFSAMRTHEAERAEVEYYGSGDSGDCFETHLSSENDDAEVLIGAKTMPLDDAVGLASEKIIGEYHSGYEDNNGGGGNLVWYKDGLLEFNAWYTSIKEDPHELRVPAAADAAAVPTDTILALSINTKIILDAMEAAGAETISVEYEGSGDSGGVEDVSFTPAIEAGVEVDLWVERSTWDATQGWQAVFNRYRVQLSDAAKMLSENITGKHFAGYENNSGGRGSITFSKAQPFAQVEHVYYDEDSDSDTFKITLVDPGLDDDQTLRLLSAHQIDPDQFQPLNDAQMRLYHQIHENGMEALLQSIQPKQAEDASDEHPRG